MKKFQKLIRQLDSLQQGYKAALHWKEIEDQAHLIAAFMHTYDAKKHTLQVIDWDGNEKTISIDPRKTPQIRMKELHAAVKKHQASLIRLERQIKEKESAIANFVEEEAAVPQVSLRRVIEPFHKYMTEQKVIILVGKNSRGNDEVTFKLARGNDLWMHAAHEKGAHVVVRLQKGKELDTESFEDALQLALKHSQAVKKGEAEVVVALKKQVSKPAKGKSGQAQVAQPQFYKVREQKVRLERLKPIITYEPNNAP